MKKIYTIYTINFLLATVILHTYTMQNPTPKNTIKHGEKKRKRSSNNQNKENRIKKQKSIPSTTSTNLPLHNNSNITTQNNTQTKNLNNAPLVAISYYPIHVGIPMSSTNLISPFHNTKHITIQAKQGLTCPYVNCGKHYLSEKGLSYHITAHNSTQY